MGEFAEANGGRRYMLAKNRMKKEWRVRHAHGVRKCPQAPAKDFAMGAVKKGLDGERYRVIRHGDGKRWQKI